MKVLKEKRILIQNIDDGCLKLVYEALLDRPEEIRLDICSGGGDTTKGIAIAQLLLQASQRGAKTEAYAYGHCSSTALSVFLACDRRVAVDGTYFLNHSFMSTTGEQYVDKSRIRETYESHEQCESFFLLLQEHREVDLPKSCVLEPVEALEIGLATEHLRLIPPYLGQPDPLNPDPSNPPETPDSSDDPWEPGPCGSKGCDQLDDPSNGLGLCRHHYDTLGDGDQAVDPSARPPTGPVSAAAAEEWGVNGCRVLGKNRPQKTAKEIWEEMAGGWPPFEKLHKRQQDLTEFRGWFQNNARIERHKLWPQFVEAYEREYGQSQHPAIRIAETEQAIRRKEH